MSLAPLSRLLLLACLGPAAAAQVSADFSADPTAGFAPLRVRFTDLSSGEVTAWEWSFGDGETSSARNPRHRYRQPGTYTVQLAVSGPGGSDTLTRTDHVLVAPPPPPAAEFVGAPLAGLTPLAVAFSDLSEGAVTSWSWTFGDGGTSTLRSPTHVYHAAGTYDVRLVVRGPGGGDVRLRREYVAVMDPEPPLAEFRGAPIAGTTPHSVAFTDLSAGTVTSWSWSFGDGGTSSQPSPEHTYTDPGVFTVALTVTGPLGTDTRTRTDYVTVVLGPPLADFAAAPQAGVAPLTVAFTDLTAGVVTSWAWDFGDRSSSTLQSPTHAYAGPGTYTVSLTAGGPGGFDTETKVDHVVVAFPPPEAAFTAAPRSGVAPLQVQFTNLSSGAVSGFQWDFGDGATSTAQNPGHTYAAPGTYTVTLQADGPGGADTQVEPGFVVVTEAAPVAGFAATPTAGVAPLSVAFTDLAAGTVTAWSWNFGDGATSAEPSPSHTYAAPGTYTVTQTVTGPGGSDALIQVDLVEVTPAAPTAAFTGVPLSGVAPLAVAFTDQSAGDVTAWSWDFGDQQASAAASPVHTYASAGTYTVRLTVIGPGGLDTLTRQDYVTVLEPPPSAAFSGAPLNGPAPLEVTFQDFSGGAIASWSWSFGDGASSTLADPVHTYAAPGTYTVSLTVTSVGGADTETRVDYVRVIQAPPMASFTGTPTSGVRPLTVGFTDTSAGEVTAWSWDFGDGSTSTSPSPVHIYRSAGTFDVSLTVEGPTGIDSVSRLDYVSVQEAPPQPAFSAAPTSGVRPLTVTFTDLTQGVVSAFAWSFGDGGSSSQESPSHTYAAAGTYTVALTATGPGGAATHAEVDLIAVSEPPPVAGFTGAPLAGTAPLTVAFTDASTGIVTARLWEFGDGGTSTELDPEHTYAAGGSYTVRLTATGPGGSDVQTRIDYVTVSDTAPTAQFVGTPLGGVAPLTVGFTDQSLGVVTSWSWSFGDLSSSTAQSPTHAYTAAGTYSVQLVAIGPGGSDTQLRTDYVVVTEPPPEARFTATPLIGAAPLAVAFTSFSLGAVTAWSWSFGDGGASTLEGPTHTYDAAGTYTVSLTVEGPGGADTLTRVDYVTVTEGAPAADFSGTPLAGNTPLTVTFTDASTGAVTSRSWDFGDRTTSTATHPVHTYTAAGTYTVSLTVLGPGGVDAETKVDYVTVGVPAPVGAFTAVPTSGPAPLTVVFGDQTTGAVTAWSWSFGDGGASTLQDPTHTYATPGVYTVSLQVTGPGGSDVATAVDLIEVTEEAPVAGFAAAPTSGLVPLTVAFTDLSTGAVTSWAWTFGDGGGSAGQNPSHTYTAPGTYTVSLTVTGPGGADVETMTDLIAVSEVPPVADFTGTPLAGVAPLQVAFTDQSTGSVTAFAWTFGDGGSSTAADPTHVYSAAGTYTVSLQVTGPGGTSTEARPDYVTVFEPPPVADFVGAPLAGAAPLTVAFTDLTAGAVSSWSWSFGDGGTSSVQHPGHVYSGPGTFTVSLTVFGPGGADTETKVDYVAVDLGLEDGSFELQTPGSLPAAPWTVTGGSGHRILPLAPPTSDNGLPTDGAQWVLLSTGGTAPATPPSNPGGSGLPPMGAAGIAQSFTFDPQNPVLVFDAAFLPGEPLPSPGRNDFLSVDVTDGTTHVNLYYADTFTPAPNTSAIFGTPMTDVARVTTNLLTWYAGADASTVLTLFAQVGNVGDSAGLSRGYLDDVSLAPQGTALFRNGSGVNPAVYVAPPPVAGGTWEASIDASGTPGVTFTILVAHVQPLAGTGTAFGELLVNTASARLFQSVQPAGSSHLFPVPATTPFLGVTGYSQGVLFGGGLTLLTNAVDLTLGYVPPVLPPVAAFNAAPTTGPAPLSVSFVAQSTGLVTGRIWDFGDGGTSALANPQHTYTAPGTYSVSLRVEGPGGFDIENAFDLVVVQ